jgi:plastocyanin
MNFPWRISASAALILAVVSCGGKPGPGPANDRTPAPELASAGTNAIVEGKLAPNVAPPSSLVALEPQSGSVIPVKTEPAVMDQASMEFIPAFLLAQAGQTVQFRNSDDVLHNIRVTEVAEQKPVFNIATPPYGNYEHKFSQPGYYSVGCDIHSTMRADILVTATPYTATTGSDGRFTFADVKPGRYNLTVYSGAKPNVRSVEVISGRTDLGVVE